MSKYRKIDVRIWNDAKFVSLSEGAKFTFLFLLTHPGMTALGAMRATIPGLAAEMQTVLGTFRERFSELLTNGLVECDETFAFVGLPNFMKYNGPDNPNAVTSWIKCLDFIPECSLKHQVLQRARECAVGRGPTFAERLAEPFKEPLPERSPNKEQEQEQELNTSSPPNPESEPPPEPPAPAAKKPESHGVWDFIKAEDLRDIGKVLGWFKRASNFKHNPVIGKSDADRLNVVATAVHTWGSGEDPHKLFCWIIHNKSFGRLTQRDEDTAHRLIKEHLEGKAKPVRVGKTESVGDVFKGLFPEAAKP